MKRIVYTLLGLLALVPAMAQNIVPNSNFKLKSACPGAPGELAQAIGWYQPTVGTPDYFNSCNTTGEGVPNNIFGDQTNHAGSYAGFYTHEFSGLYREYVATDIPALVPGATYKVTIRISLADKIYYATDGIGVLFYKYAKPDSAGYDDNITATPQVDYTSFGVIRAKSVWTTLTKNFVADSAYTHLIVGCFLSDVDQTKEVDTPGSFPANISYYYIDSVAVENITPSVVPPTNSVNTELYPNPVTSSSVLTFYNPLGLPHELRIYDMQGRLVMRRTGITNGSVMIPRDDLSTGIHYYQLYDDGRMVAVGKMLVE